MAHFKHQPFYKLYKFKQFKLIKQCLNCLIAHLESLMCPNIAIPYSLHGGKKKKEKTTVLLQKVFISYKDLQYLI